jgi:hypothetical protein
MNQEAEEQLEGILVRSLDRIIDWVAVDPDRIVADYRKRGALTLDGEPIQRFEDIRHAHPAMARRVSRAHIASHWKLAAGQGFVTGVGGMVSLPAAAPADAIAYVAWLARTGSAIQHAHGLDRRDHAGDTTLKLAMLAGAGVRDIGADGSAVPIGQLARTVTSAPSVRLPVRAAARALTRRFGVCQASGGFARCVPLVGGALNGTLSAGLVRGAGARMLQHYQTVVFADRPGRIRAVSS